MVAGHKFPQWPLVDHLRVVASNSSVAETNAIYGQATNGCRWSCGWRKTFVRAGQPVTIFVTIQNVGKSKLYYSWTSLELPWSASSGLWTRPEIRCGGSRVRRRSPGVA